MRTLACDLCWLHGSCRSHPPTGSAAAQLTLDGTEEAPPPPRRQPPPAKPQQTFLFDPSRQAEREEIEEEAQHHLPMGE